MNDLQSAKKSPINQINDLNFNKEKVNQRRQTTGLIKNDSKTVIGHDQNVQCHNLVI